MEAHGFWQYVGRVPGVHTPVRSSARCIVYDHIRQRVYATTDDAQMAKEITLMLRARDRGGDYRMYQLDGDDWRELQVEDGRSPASVHPPAMFLFWWCNAWAAADF